MSGGAEKVRKGLRLVLLDKEAVAADEVEPVAMGDKQFDKTKVLLEDSIGIAVRKILAFQLNRLREQIPGIKQDIDLECVHKARVATRRMRSALRLFKKALPVRAQKTMSMELKWLGGLLGAVRDIDVFLLNMPRLKLPGSVSDEDKRLLNGLIAKRREEPLKKLIKTFDAPRYKRLESRIERFSCSPVSNSGDSPLAHKYVYKIAPALINEKFDAVIKGGRIAVRKGRLKAFHRLRIRMKRFRYALEFMAAAYGGALEPAIKKTEEIQDRLGEIQDTVFTRSFIDSLRKEFARSNINGRITPILDAIYELQEKTAKKRCQRFYGVWRRFVSVKTEQELNKAFLRRQDEV
jgi:CHAD domain-containing protein